MKRIISLMLCLSMLLSMVPATVLASETEEAAVAETYPAAETTQAPAEVPMTEPTEAAAAETAAAWVETVPETTAAPEVPETTEATVPQETEAEEIFWEYNYIPDEDFPDSDELFAAYVEQQFYGTEMATFGFAAGERLSGDEKLAYDALVSAIRDIAEGNRSSAVISIGPNGEIPVSFTKGFYDIDLDSLLHALLSDLPYDLFWFNKTGIPEQDKGGIYMSGSVSGSGTILTLTFSFMVSANYSSSGEEGTYVVDSAKIADVTQRVKTAAANARAIVDENAHLSDYDKLVAYKEAICDMTSYNDPAASSGDFSKDNDPWQLINVFDGKQSTKVVCEGYAKAFQYLCDLSEFTGDITCYSVSGFMSGGTGIGAHMWNIVSINGRNYLADITNSDTGTVGANGKLFLAGNTPNADGSYTINRVRFTYNNETLYLWGTGEDSILNLAGENYDPAADVLPPDSSLMTGEELLAAMENSSGVYELRGAVEITSDLVLPTNVYLNVTTDGSITVRNGATLTVSSSMGVANGGILTVEAGATFIVNILGIGGSSTCTIDGTLVNNRQININYGTLILRGTYVPGENSRLEADIYATVLGIDKSLITLYAYADSEESLVRALVPKEGYGSQTVYLVCPNYSGVVDGPIRLTGDITVEEGITLQIGYFAGQSDSVTIADGARLTVNGTLSIISTSTVTIEEGGKLINNGGIFSSGTILNNGILKGEGEFSLSGILEGNDILTGDALATDNFLDSLTSAESSGEELVIRDPINLSGDLTIRAPGGLSFADGAELTVSRGATLTLDCPTVFNGGELIVEEGATLVNNADLIINNPQHNGDAAVFSRTVQEDSSAVSLNGNLENNGSLWINTGSTADINGYVSGNGPIFVGFGGNSRLNINGQLDTTGHLCVNEGGTLHLAEGAKLNLLGQGGGYLDNQGTAYLNGEVYIEGLMTSGARRDEETGAVVGSEAVIEIKGTVTASATSSIGVSEGGTIACFGPATTAGEVIVEPQGTLWVDNTVSITGPGKLTIDGALHVDHFDEFATADGVLNVDTETHVNGYWAIHEGGTLNVGENATVGIYNNENGCGYLDNQGSVTMNCHLYLEGLCTTGAARDEQGNVVGAPASAAFNQHVDITGTGFFGVLEDGSVTLYNLNNHGGEFSTESGGKLAFAEFGDLHNFGGTVSLADGTLQDGLFGFTNHMVNGQFGSLNGAPKGQTMLYCHTPDSMDDIRTVITELETGKYGDASIQIGQNFVMDEDILLPEDLSIQMVRTPGLDKQPVLTIPEGITVTNNGVIRITEGTVLVLLGTVEGNQPINDGGTITFNPRTIGHFFSDGADFFENDVARPGYGLWAGNTATIYPVILDETGMVETTQGITATFSDDFRQYATVTEMNGTYTITALSTLTSHQTLSVTFSADDLAPVTVYFHLRPKAEAADICLDGKTVTGSTVTIDANSTDRVRQLSSLITSQHAVPARGVLIDGADPSDEPMDQWTSSNTTVATVDETGAVTFTGEPGIVKITLTAEYGTKKTAVVTFNVLDLPQQLRPAPGTFTKLIGGKAASYSVIDENDVALTAKDVQWFFVDEWGNLTDACPYATVKNGKLTTKAVSDPYEVRLTAKLAAIEDGAMLAEPITVTLYPAVSSASIRLGAADGQIINGQTLPLDTALYDSMPLYADVAPCAESVKSISWKSSKTAVAEIDANGLLIPIGTGKVKITMTVETLDRKKTTATCNFNVGALVQNISLTAMQGEKQLDLNNLVISGGETITFSAATDPVEPTTAGVKWTVPASHKAYASFKGSVLTAKNVTNRVTVPVICESKDGNCVKEISVTILPKPVQVGGEVKPALLIQNAAGEYITKTTVTMAPGTDTWLYGSETVQKWESNNPTIVTIDENGHLKALNNGTAKITATAADGRTAEVTVKVAKVAKSVNIITKKGEPFTVAAGKSLNLVAETTYSDNTVNQKGKVTWTLENNQCGAKISTSGTLSAPKALTEAATVTVVATSKEGPVANIQHIRIVPATTGLEIFGPFGNNSYSTDISNITQAWDLASQDDSFRLNARVFPAGALNAVSWKSSSAKVATVDKFGNVTCLKPGTTTITATSADGSNKKASFKLTVTQSMSYLSLPKEAILGSGKSLNFTKLEGFAMDSSASNKNLIWTLTDLDGYPVSRNVATLSNKGVLKAGAKVNAPMEVVVRAKSADGSGLQARCIVAIFPAAKGIALYAMDEKTAITGSTIEIPISGSCNILTDTTNVPGFGYHDDNTADEFLPNGTAWEITESPKLRMEFDGQAVSFYPTAQARVGDTVKITFKALDGSNKSAAVTFRITEAVLPEQESKTIGIALPNQSSRWLKDGNTMVESLSDMGHEVILMYAQNSIETQIIQIETMLAQGIDCLVLSCVDPYQMGSMLEDIDFGDVSVLAYDRLPTNTDAISYYTTFDNRAVGALQGNYIVEALDLEHAGNRTYNIEYITGDLDDGNTALFFNGALSVLQPYMDAGTLVCPSGQTTLEEAATLWWSTENAQTRFEDILANHYSGGTHLDAVLSSADILSVGVTNALTNFGMTDYILTGQDCDLEAVRNIISGTQSMSVFKDSGIMAGKAVEMILDIVSGNEPEINNTTGYHNGSIYVPTCLCLPTAVTADNYEEILIDSGYYTEEQIRG